MKSLSLTVLAGWLVFSANQAVAVSTTASFPISFSKDVPISTDCVEKYKEQLAARPMVPMGAAITSNMLLDVNWDDGAELTGGGGKLILGGCNMSGNIGAINLLSTAIARSDGSFDIDVYDKTDTNNDGFNRIMFTATQVVTYNVANPLPPQITDTNIEEQVCVSRHDGSDDGEMQVVSCYKVLGCSSCCIYGSPQVSFGLANFNVKVEDVPIWHETSVGEPLELRMRFSNYGDAGTNQTFGPKWSCNWNSRVTVLNSNTNQMVFPSGSVALFTQSVANVFLPPSALEGTLYKTNGMYRYVLPDGWSWEYTPSASNANVYLLSAVRDAWSNTVGVTYTNDRLYRVQQTVPDTGRFLEFRYAGAGSRATSVVLRSTTTNLEKSASFSYSPAGWMTNVVDMGGFSFGYLYNGQYLDRVKKGSSDRMVVTYSSLPNTWTASSNYWVQMTDAGGVERKYTWLFGLVQEDVTRSGEHQVKFHNISTAGSRGRVLAGSMSSGVQQQYQYNAQGRVTNRIDRTGAQWRQTYNAQNRLLTMTDPLGNRTTNVYDASGVDLLYQIPPVGPIQQVLTYVPGKHAVATESNALGRVVSYAYNSMGLVTNSSDGRITNAYSYNVEGRLTAHYRNGDLVATNQYDAFGRLYSTLDAAGLVTWFPAYDGLNRSTVQWFDNQGQPSTNAIAYDCCSISQFVDRDGNEWNFQQNDIGERLWESNPVGLTNFYAYGIEGKPVAISNALHWTTRQYTNDGRSIKVKYPTDRSYDPSEHSANYWYDGEGRLTKRQTVTGAFYQYGYDEMGRLVSAGVPTGSNLPFGVEAGVPALSNRYDALGRKWWSKDIRGLATSNAFNAVGQVLKTYYPDATTEEWTYDKWGQVLSYKDRANNTASNIYDAQGRLWQHVDARQLSTFLTYTNADLVASVSNSAGQVWRFAYDAQRRVKEIVHPDPALVETFSYSPMGNVTQHVSGGVVRSMAYDSLGKLASVRVNGALVESNRYDRLGRLAWSQGPDGLVVSNAWDSWGELMSRQWPGPRMEYFQYSERGRTAYRDRLTNSSYFGRDSLGREIQRTDAVGNVVSNAFWSNGVDQVQFLWDGNRNPTVWTYDLYGNPTNKLFVGGTNRFQYDKLNQVTNKLDAANVATRYSYDAGGNLLTLAPGANPAVSFAYDAMNRPTNMVDGVGTTVWAYDAMNRLRSETGPFSGAVSATYDSLGRMTNLSFAGRTWAYRYDALGRITNVLAPEGTYRLGYLDQSARKTSVSYPNGILADMAYDSWKRLTNLSHSVDSVNKLGIRYSYDAGDRRTGEEWYTDAPAYPFLSQSHSYDAAHRLLDTTGSVPAGYRYDGAGNLVRFMELGLGVTNFYASPNLLTYSGCTQAQITVSGVVNYNAGTVTVNGVVAERSGKYYQRTNVTLGGGGYTNLITAVYRGPAFTNLAMVATSITRVVVGSSFPGYDANGNMTNDANFVYRYDVLNRLTNVLRRTNGVSVLANRFDGLGRRVEATRNGTNVERYVYVPGTFLVLAVLDATNGVKETFTHGPDLSGTLGGAGGIGGILSQTVGNNVVYLHPDAAGNVVLATGAAGAVVGTNRYTPYGSLVSRLGAYNGRFMFSSKEWEPTVGLYYYGYRFYSPTLGRWLSRDPLGEFADPLHNLYRFVGNNPLNAVDPDGRLVIFVHGTWSSGTEAFPNDFRQHVLAYFHDQNSMSYEWSGDNCDKQRRSAGTGLATQIMRYRRQYPNEPIRIVAHSHGGNVALVASQTQGVTIDTLVTLGTPAMKVYQPGQGIGIWNNVYSTADRVQTLPFRAGRTQTSAKNIILQNFGHSDLHTINSWNAAFPPSP